MALKFEEHADRIKKWRNSGLTYIEIAKRIGAGCTTSHIGNILKKLNPPPLSDRRPGALAATVRRATMDARRGREDGETSCTERGSGESKDGLKWLISQYTGEHDPALVETMQIFVGAEFEGLSEGTIAKRLKLGCETTTLKEGYPDLYNQCKADHVRKVSEKYKLSLFHVHEQLAGMALRATEESRRLIEDPDVKDSIKRAAVKDVYDLTIRNTPVSNTSQKTVDLGDEFKEAMERAERTVKQKNIGDVVERQPN